MVLELTRSRLTGWLALAAGLVLASLLHGTGPKPPLYDGIALPQPPYRYVSPPPGLRDNKPPESGEATFPVRGGRVIGGGVATADNQVTVFLPLDAFRIAAGTQSVRVRIEPVQNPPAPPPGAEIRGNVYLISAIQQPSGAAADLLAVYAVTMRFPPGPFQRLQFYDGTAWRPLDSHTLGSDPYARANFDMLGELAATAAPGASVSIFTTLLRLVEGYGLLAFIIVFGIIAVVQEVRRRRKSQ